MTKSDRTLTLFFLFLTTVGGLALGVLIFQALTWAPVLLSSVSWNG